MWIVLLLVLSISTSVFGQHSGMNCEPLDPRVKIAKETETRINASVKTVLKVAQAGGEVERKAKEEIQNLPSGDTGKNQIELRWIYLFCEMLRTSGNLSEAQKKQYLDAVTRATKSTSQAPAAPKTKAKDLASRSKLPTISIVGALPIHLWDKRPVETSGTTKSVFLSHEPAFILKVQNHTNSATRVNVGVIEGCLSISLISAKNMLVDGETAPEKIDLYGELQKATVQRIKLSGTIRADSRDVPALGIGYIGIRFPLPVGSGGASLVVPETATTKGKCDNIKKWSSHPSVSQLFKMGAVNFTAPRDIADEFRDGRLNIRLHTGNGVFEVDPSVLGKLYSVRDDRWERLLLPQMYEVPDADFPPTGQDINPRK